MWVGGYERLVEEISFFFWVWTIEVECIKQKSKASSGLRARDVEFRRKSLDQEKVQRITRTLVKPRLIGILQGAFQVE